MKKYMIRKILLRAAPCILLCLIFLGCQIKFMMDCRRYNYWHTSEFLMSWNFRELGNYPEHQIIYVKPSDEWFKLQAMRDEKWGYEAGDLLTWYEFTCADLEVGVYPYLDEELEKEIRALGYPFDFHGITYVGTDNYSDIGKNVGRLMINLGYEVETAEKLKDPKADILRKSTSPFFPYDGPL